MSLCVFICVNCVYFVCVCEFVFVFMCVCDCAYVNVCVDMQITQNRSFNTPGMRRIEMTQI